MQKLKGGFIMRNRRDFLKTLSSAGLLLGVSSFPLDALAAEYTKLTILHTNDVHSRIEPFDGGKYDGLGGAARRAALVKKIRQEEQHVLLLDCGDIFQGTPYFNFFSGEVEFRLMNAMGYDAATIGNHDFDGGLAALQQQLKTAKFPMLSSNYDFSKTLLSNYTKPYHIIEKGPLKIGLFGLGVELDGLVPPKLFGKTVYQDPLAKAKETARLLKVKEKCDFVICLSHLGYTYEDLPNRISDRNLAGKTSYIDMILGGHTHTFLDEPQLLQNENGQAVIVNQVGWAGILLGRIDVYFSKQRGKRKISSTNIEVR